MQTVNASTDALARSSPDPNQPLFLLGMPFHPQPFEAWVKIRGFEDVDHAMHCLLTEIFGDKALRPFRLIASPRLPMGTLYGYAHEDGSEMQVHAQLIADPIQAAIFDLNKPITAKKMPQLSKIARGSRLGFEVRIRPTYRRPYYSNGPLNYSRQHEHDAYHAYLRDHHSFDYRPQAPAEINHIRHQAYGGWLFRHFRQQKGASLEPYTFNIISYRRVPVVRKFGTPPILGPDVTCRGNFIVEDPERFEQLITNGIGRHRAYGYGMILFRQPHDVQLPPGCSDPPPPEFENN